ncbi:MAG: DNA repair and recombination protein RadA [Promethearchaeota archaeon]
MAKKTTRTKSTSSKKTTSKTTAPVEVVSKVENNEDTTSIKEKPGSDVEVDQAFEEAIEEEITDELAGDEINEFPGLFDVGEMTINDIPGVGPSIAKKLRDSGFTSIKALATLSPRILQEESGIGEKTALKITQAAQEICKIDFVTADKIFERRKKIGRIVTGSNALNELLGGGIESGAVTELFGEFRTGKTQIAHQLCVNVQLPADQGGLGGKALYVDTEGTFRPERLAQMALAKGLKVNDVLKNVIYARAYNSEHQVNILKKAREKIEEENIKLIVVDSIIGHFRSEYYGLGSLAPRQQLLNVHLHQIVQLAETYSIAAVITNQVQSKPDVFFGDPTRAAGGNIIAHGSTYRLYLRKSKADTRVAKMIDAPGLPEAEAAFRITENGIEDV